MQLSMKSVSWMKTSDVKLIYSVKCITRRCVNSEDEYWICCDICSLWFHCSCAGVPFHLAQDESFKFFLL